MPNYTMEFSEQLIHLQPEERSWLEERLAQMKAAERWILFEYAFEEEGDKSTSFWIHSDEQLPDELLELIQAFFRQFRPDQYLVVSFALTCSRPLVGEFGGGKVFVSADRVVWSDLNAWASEQVDLFQQSLRKSLEEGGKAPDSI